MLLYCLRRKGLVLYLVKALERLTLLATDFVSISDEVE